MSPTHGRLKLKINWWFYAVGFGLFAALGIHGLERSNYVLLGLLGAVGVGVLWRATEDVRLLITDEGITRLRLFRASVNLKWTEVRRVYYKHGFLTIEGSGEETVVNQHVYRNRNELLNFIRQHIPPSVAIPQTWWERRTGAA